VIAVDIDYDRLAETLAPKIAERLQQPAHAPGFLDVDGAAAFLASTPDAVRAMVRREQVPFHRTPNSRLLFDPAELEAWVRAG
jgi:hypothetical protein